MDDLHETVVAVAVLGIEASRVGLRERSPWSLVSWDHALLMLLLLPGRKRRRRRRRGIVVQRLALDPSTLTCSHTGFQSRVESLELVCRLGLLLLALKQFDLQPVFLPEHGKLFFKVALVALFLVVATVVLRMVLCVGGRARGMYGMLTRA